MCVLIITPASNNYMQTSILQPDPVVEPPIQQSFCRAAQALYRFEQQFAVAASHPKPLLCIYLLFYSTHCHIVAELWLLHLWKVSVKSGIRAEGNKFMAAAVVLVALAPL